MHLLFRLLILSLCLLRPALAQPPFELQALAPGVYAVIDREGRAGANAGIVVGNRAVLVVDSLYREAASRALLEQVRALTQLPIRYLLNTHHHIDHVAGNRLFAEVGATVVAQRQLAGWIHVENLRLLGGEQATPEVQAQVQGLLAPQLGFDQQLSLDLGGRRVELQHRLGHTGADSVVWLPDVRVMFTGDLLWRRSIPNLLDANLVQWRATLAALAQLPEDTRFVPGHGGVAGLQELREFDDYLAALEQAVARHADDAAALEALRPRYGGWAYFKGLAAANVRDARAESQGRKRVPRP